MNKTADILSRNLQFLVQRDGLAVTELARMTGIQQPTLYRIVKGKVRNPEYKSLDALASYFGISVDALRTEPLWALVDAGPVRSLTSRSPSATIGHPHNNNGVIPVRKVPLIAISDVPAWIRTMDESQVNVIRMVTASTDVGEKAFAVIQEDDSMISSSPPVSILPGYTLIIDPMIPRSSGRIVCALPRGASKPTIKRYMEDAGRMYLEPLNPRYPIIEIDSRCIFLGVVTAIQIRL